METRASFIATMQETQHLSPEKGQSPANGNIEQFDSGELSFTPWVVFTGTALQLVTGRGGDSQIARGALGMVVQLEGLF